MKYEKKYNLNNYRDKNSKLQKKERFFRKWTKLRKMQLFNVPTPYEYTYMKKTEKLGLKIYNIWNKSD
jgi:hypothetical protein